mmetsp:Transcript_4629/g.4345  ORF Transcript_4629/g.4345 Transcript_4629/m.4345 type:complete len:226 (-) Transcript_4629:320-997(-)
MRYIFQDSLLKHDIKKFVTESMILAMEAFSSDNWSIRNSALMSFTALTKRLLNTLNVQEQDLAKKKGLTTWDFFGRHHQLSEYFLKKLRECQGQIQGQKDKEKSDLVIFSILLLISRLVPSFEYSEDQKLQEVQGQRKPKELFIKEYIELIGGYSKNATYFVRKISAQALLPLIKLEDYLEQIKQDSALLQASLTAHKMKQNEAHGVMIRISVFLRAYFKYRHLI